MIYHLKQKLIVIIYEGNSVNNRFHSFFVGKCSFSPPLFQPKDVATHQMTNYKKLVQQNGMTSQEFPNYYSHWYGTGVAEYPLGLNTETERPCSS